MTGKWKTHCHLERHRDSESCHTSSEIGCVLGFGTRPREPALYSRVHRLILNLNHFRVEFYLDIEQFFSSKIGICELFTILNLICSLHLAGKSLQNMQSFRVYYAPGPLDSSLFRILHCCQLTPWALCLPCIACPVHLVHLIDLSTRV